MRFIAGSKSPLLHPDNNPLLRAILKPVIYDQFCAGTNPKEIHDTQADIKRLGFSGVILCYGKELEVDASGKAISSSSSESAESDPGLARWRDGNLETLAMIGKGDWLGIK